MLPVIFNYLTSTFILSSVLKGAILALIVCLSKPYINYIYLTIKHGSDYTTFLKVASTDSFILNGLCVKREDIISLYVPSEYSLDIKNKITGTIIGKTSDNVLFIKSNDGGVVAYSSWAIPLKDIVFIKRKSLFTKKTIY